MPKFVRISLAVAALAGVGITTAACSADEDAAAASAAATTDAPMVADYKPGSAKSKPAKAAAKAAPVDPDVAKAARVVLLTERQQRDMDAIIRISATIDDSNVESMCVDAGVITRKLAKVEQRQRAVKRIVRTMDNPPSKALSALGDANEALSGLRSAADTLKTICGI